jgi:hypothetical protein
MIKNKLYYSVGKDYKVNIINQEQIYKNSNDILPYDIPNTDIEKIARYYIDNLSFIKRMKLLFKRNSINVIK